jgi:hypothetical protein
MVVVANIKLLVAESDQENWTSEAVSQSSSGGSQLYTGEARWSVDQYSQVYLKGEKCGSPMFHRYRDEYIASRREDARRVLCMFHPKTAKDQAWYEGSYQLATESLTDEDKLFIEMLRNTYPYCSDNETIKWVNDFCSQFDPFVVLMKNSNKNQIRLIKVTGYYGKPSLAIYYEEEARKVFSQLPTEIPLISFDIPQRLLKDGTYLPSEIRTIHQRAVNV